MLEEMDAKFGGENHVDMGGNLMGLDDAHHADIAKGGPSKRVEAEHVEEIRQ